MSRHVTGHLHHGEVVVQPKRVERLFQTTSGVVKGYVESSGHLNVVFIGAPTFCGNVSQILRFRKVYILKSLTKPRGAVRVASLEAQKNAFPQRVFRRDRTKKRVTLLTKFCPPNTQLDFQIQNLKPEFESDTGNLDCFIKTLKMAGITLN